MNQNTNKHAMLSMKDEDSFFSSLLKSNTKAVLMARDDQNIPSIKTEKSNTNTPLEVKKQLLLINPNEATNWAYPDRPESELGNLQSLAHSMSKNGQAEPCIARLSKSQKFKYEIIVGERRWRAAKLGKISLEIILYSLNDNQAALIQAAENLDRKDLSDFARGMSLAKLLKEEVLTQKDLQQRFNLSKVEINRFLSFRQLPSAVIDAIQDMRKVSSRLATEIRALCNKGYTKQILILADKIRQGSVGSATLKKRVEELISPTKKTEQKISIKNTNNQKEFLLTFKNSGKIEISTKKGSDILVSDAFRDKLIQLLKSIHMDT